MTTPALHIKRFEEASFGENAYVVVTTNSREEQVGWIIDPSFPPQVNELLDHVSKERIGIERIILTHGHIDHIAGVDEVKKQHPTARLAIAAAERGSLSDPDENLSSLMGMPFQLETQPDDDLPPGGELRLGELTWKILDVSGHSPAGRALYCPDAGVVIVGDALFAGGIGRYDFPGSDGRRLLRNIRQQLLSLPGGTAVYSGHGGPTTIENERKFNHFLTE